MNMTKKTNAKIQYLKSLVLFSCLFLFTTATLHAQVIFRLSDDNALDIAHMDISVENFDNILGLQYAIKYDPSQLTFLGADNFHPEFVSSGIPEFFIVSSSPGEIRVLWVEPLPINGKTLTDGEVLFSVSFEVNTIEIAEVELGEGVDLPYDFEVTQLLGSVPASVLAEAFSGFNNPNGALITGHVFEDANDNCVNDGEAAYEGWSVKASGANGTFYRATDATGYYKAIVDPGTYDLK